MRNLSPAAFWATAGLSAQVFLQSPVLWRLLSSPQDLRQSQLSLLPFERGPPFGGSTLLVWGVFWSFVRFRSSLRAIPLSKIYPHFFSFTILLKSFPIKPQQEGFCSRRQVVSQLAARAVIAGTDQHAACNQRERKLACSLMSSAQWAPLSPCLKEGILR